MGTALKGCHFFLSLGRTLRGFFRAGALPVWRFTAGTSDWHNGRDLAILVSRQLREPNVAAPFAGTLFYFYEFCFNHELAWTPFQVYFSPTVARMLMVGQPE